MLKGIGTDRQSKELCGAAAARIHTRHPIDHVTDRMEAVHFIQNDHVEGGGGSPCPIIADVRVRGIRPTIAQTMDQPGIAEEGKDDGLVV